MNLTRIFAMAGLMSALLGAGFGFAEELDLSAARAFDWAQASEGRVVSAHCLLSPTDEPKELAKELRKQFGVRLTTDDAAPTLIVSAGIAPAGARLTITRADIDRIKHLVEVSATLELPEPGAEPPAPQAAPAPEEPVLMIGRAQAPVPNPAPERPTPRAAENEKEGGNPALRVPAGRLDPGSWWLRYKLTIRQGERTTVRPAQTEAFTVKDLRPADQARGRQRDTEPGLQAPTSKSVTEGMGMGP